MGPAPWTTGVGVGDDRRQTGKVGASELYKTGFINFNVTVDYDFPLFRKIAMVAYPGFVHAEDDGFDGFQS